MFADCFSGFRKLTAVESKLSAGVKATELRRVLTRSEPVG